MLAPGCPRCQILLSLIKGDCLRFSSRRRPCASERPPKVTQFDIYGMDTGAEWDRSQTASACASYILFVFIYIFRYLNWNMLIRVGSLDAIYESESTDDKFNQIYGEIAYGNDSFGWLYQRNLTTLLTLYSWILFKKNVSTENEGTLLKKTVVYTVTHRKSLTVSNRKIFYGHSP